MWKPPNPQIASTVHDSVTGLSLLLMPVQLVIKTLNAFQNRHLHPSRSEGAMASISFIQGGNRAPRKTNALEEGPNIGLTDGYRDQLKIEQ